MAVVEPIENTGGELCRPRLARPANDAARVLGADVWTRNACQSAELDAGGAAVIDCTMTVGVSESPLGRVKESGIGHVDEEAGLRGSCQVQSIGVDRLGGKREPLWFPWSNRKLGWMRRATRFLWETSIGRWLS